jgi:hypothetical protein
VACERQRAHCRRAVVRPAQARVSSGGVGLGAGSHGDERRDPGELRAVLGDPEKRIEAKTSGK